MVVCKVERVTLVTDNKQLYNTKQGVGITIAWIIFVINNLLHSAAWHDIKGFKLNLNNRDAVNQ